MVVGRREREREGRKVQGRKEEGGSRELFGAL